MVLVLHGVILTKKLSDKVIEKEEARLLHLASILVHVFQLPTPKIKFDHELEHWGLCYIHENTIVMRCVDSAGRKLLSQAFNVDTLCHELAHLVEPGHNNKHRRLLQAMLVWARRNGY